MAFFKPDLHLFHRRMSRIYDAWDVMTKADFIVVLVGQTQNVDESRSTTLEEWIFKLEIGDILMVFGKSCIYFYSSKKKIDFLRPLAERAPSNSKLPKLELLTRAKEGSNQASFDKILSGMKPGSRIGVFAKDKFPGDFYQECEQQIFNDKSKFERVDVTPVFAYVLAVKEEIELDYTRKACAVSEAVYLRGFWKELLSIIDNEKKVSHKKLAEKLNEAISKDAVRYVDNKDVDTKSIDTCYVPIIQSGGNYSLRFSSISSEENINYGSVVISSIGFKYKDYCSNISRTVMIQPTDQQKKNYEFLLHVADEIISRLRDGVVLSKLYQDILDHVRNTRADFVDKLTKNFGFVTGLNSFRESHLVIGPKTNAKARKNMTFVIAVGFSDLVNEDANDSKTKNYALFLSDTVVVNDSETPASLLTQKKRKPGQTSIILKNDDESEEENEENHEENNKDNDVIINESLRVGTRRRVLEDRLRHDPQGNDARRKQHQKELLEQLNAAAKARLSKSSGGSVETKVKKSIVAYKSVKEFPRENEISDLKIYVDKKNETVILPIFGVPVPFHISTIKNVSNSVEGDYLYLRINFFFPGSTLEKGSVFPTNEAIFLKELTYRSYAIKEQGEVNSPAQNLQDSFMSIKTVQKKFKTRVDEEKELAGVVKQDALVLTQNKVGPKLKDLYIRPNIYQKRISGSLEAHVNGFRFTSIKNDKVDIMYNNIKHAIYQPCDGEMIILLHFNLKNPIMLNKKKHLHIQLYTEVGEITTDLGKRQHMHDRDDYAAEAAERDLRNKLKLAFKSFCDKVEAATKGDVSFEIPIREMGFYGVPKKSNVLLQPTPNALVNLTDPEPTVITLSEIELVHLERVSFQLKNFDMTIVFKDYNIKPLSISSVEMCKLEDIKNWLDRCDIKFTSGKHNLNWQPLMKKILSDLDHFFDEEGGWAILDEDADDEEGDEDDEDDEDDQYSPSEDETEEDEDESEISEEESEFEESGSGDLGSSEESGKDWSELEEEAANSDRNNRDFVEDSSRRRLNGGSTKRKSYDDGRGGGKKKR